MSDARLVYATDDDWEAMYNNGRLLPGVEQNHSIQFADVLTALTGQTVVSFERIEVDMEEGMAEWLGPDGFPEYLSQIPQEARTA